MYYFNRETEPFFGGVFETQGGGAGNGAEPGASGTTFLKHVVSGHSAIRVDNKNQTPAGDVIHNVGRELSLGGGKIDGIRYLLPNGVVVSSSAGYDNYKTSLRHYDLGQLFDDNPSTTFRAASQSTRITVIFRATVIVNHVRIYPWCSNPARFKVST